MATAYGESLARFWIDVASLVPKSRQDGGDNGVWPGTRRLFMAGELEELVTGHGVVMNASEHG